MLFGFIQQVHSTKGVDMSSGMSRRKFLQVAGTSAAGLLAAACVAPTPGGGAAESGAAEATTLVFSSYTWSGYEAAMTEVINLWKEENAGIEVEGQFAAEDYWTKLQTQMASGVTPDVGIADYGRTVSYAKTGTLLPLDDYIARDGFDLEQFIPAAVAQYRWREGDFDSGGEGGTMYGLPSDAQGFIFAYNKTRFDEAGVAYPTDDWTWDDLVEAAVALTNADADQWGVAAPGLGTLLRGNFIYAAGGEFITPDFTEMTLDAEATVAAYQWVWDLIYTHNAAARPNPSQQVNPFMSGQTAMYFDGVWWIADLASITDFEWDLAMFPKHPQTGMRTTSLESDGWWAFAASQNPDLAWNLVAYLGNAEGQAKFAELNYVIPPAIPAAGEAWYELTPPENRGKALQNLVEDSRKVHMTYFEVQIIAGIFNPILDRAFFDGEPLEGVIVEAQEAANQELQRAWERFEA
jgi:multiple sugar transport system substrate-binding protein